MNVLTALLSNVNSWKSPRSATDLICAESQKARKRRQTCFFAQIQPITQTTVIESATQFLLSDVLHCTNINTDFTDFSK